ncbi:MAG: S-adenosylmethionine synthase [Candidatus Marinimicrobia bacterium]|nr:S-adenosylmethionine synthase [Candidatus Neomarinimicrobiota bacterium]
MGSYLFTSESVTEGHPDKIADQISDSVLDAILEDDPHGRVACETFVSTGLVLVGGEITTETYVDFPDLVRGTIKRIGYIDAAMGFDYQTCSVLSAVGKQSPDIAQGVDENTGLHKEQGAGDQGMMFGYAVNETDELMPLTIQLAHALTKRLSVVRNEGILPYLRPDGKAQVTVSYDEGTQEPLAVHTVVVSTQHDEAVSLDQIKKDVLKHVIKPVLPAELTDYDTLITHINPTGRFVIGGPMGDAGVTGRKIIVDTYGGAAPHGGGAFSGKDPSKVDRSAAYAARYAAKNVVAAGLAEKCSVELAYAIGVADPVSVYVDTHGTGKIDNQTLQEAVAEHFPLKPQAIISHFDLLRPIYTKTAAYGHFGRSEFPWEQTDKVDSLSNLL